MALTGTTDGRAIYSKRQKYERLRAQLENERSTFKSQWRELNDYVLPRRARFFVSDSNKGDRRNLKIIDSTATLSARTLRSGMMGGITSPARPWFRLTIPDADMSESGPVKEWLHEITTRMTTVFLRSNLYNVLPIIYGDIGIFGTAALFHEEDFDNVMRFYSFPIGSYMIANNDKLQVDVFIRDFRMTVRQIVNKFGVSAENPTKVDWTNISSKVKSLWDSNNPEAWIDLCHVVAPNDEWDPNKLESKYKKYVSVYYEKGYSGNASQGSYLSGPEPHKFLSEKGYDYFPVLCPRWEVTGEDVYGTDCPGMTAIGDVKQLQTGEKRALQAVEKMINPPMIGPESLRNKKASVLPGDITYLDVREGMQGFRSAHDINFNLGALEEKQQQVRQRISRSFFEDLFLMLANTDRRQITAREIDERHEEKMLALGPVLEQLNQDLLDPLIENTFNIMAEQGLLPDAPEEIRGNKLKVEYISVMAQAQKLVGLGGIERFTNYVGGIAQVDPGVLDKVITDQLVDVYGDLTSIPPGIVRSDDDTEELRAQRAQAQAQAQQQEAMAQAAETAKTMSETSTEGENALTEVAGGLAQQ